MRPTKPPRLKDIIWIKLEIHQLEHGLELTIDTNNKLVICDIRKNSAAREDGRLGKGDVILQINDVTVEGESVEFARHLLHSFSKSSSFISIKVRKAKPLEVTSLHVDTDGSPKRGHPSPILSDLSATESKEVKYVNKEEYVEKWTKVHCNRKWSGEELNLKCTLIHLVKDQLTGVGIDLCEADARGNPKHRKYVIHNIREGSPAQRDGRLRIGQVVLAINGKPLTACDSMDINQLLDENIVQLAVETSDTMDVSELPPPICPDDIFLLPPFCDEDHMTEEWGGHVTNGHNIINAVDHLAGVWGNHVTTGEEFTDTGDNGVELWGSHMARDQEFTDIGEVVDSENSHISVVLRKKTKGKGLGFSVVGGVDTPQGAMGIHIKTLYPNGLAAECGLLRPGDEIISVNGQSLAGLRHQQAVDMFKGLKRGTVVIRAKKRLHRTRPACETETHLSENKLPAHLQNDKRSVWTDEGVLIQEIKLYKDPVLGLGFDVTSNTESGLLKVAKIAKGSSADLCKRIRLGDDLLKINNLHIKNYKGEQAMQLLNNIPPGPVTLKTRRDAEKQTPKEADDNLQGEPPGGYIQQLSGSLLLENYLNTAQRYENGLVNEALDVSTESIDTPQNHTHSSNNNNPDLSEGQHFDPNVILPLPEEFQDVSEVGGGYCSESDSVSTSQSKSSRSRVTSPSRNRSKAKGHNSVVDLEDILIEFDPKKEEKWIQKIHEENMRGSKSRSKSASEVFTDGVKKQRKEVGGEGTSDNTGISASLVVAAATAVALTGVSKVKWNNGNQANSPRRAEGMGHDGEINEVVGDNNKSDCCIDERQLKNSWSVDRGATEGDVCGCSGNQVTEKGNEQEEHGRASHATAGKVIEEGSKSVDRDCQRVNTEDVDIKVCESVVQDIQRKEISVTGYNESQKHEEAELDKSCETIQDKINCNYYSESSSTIEKDMAHIKARKVDFVQGADSDSIDSARLRRKRTRPDKIEILVIQRLPGEKLGMGINIESKGDESDYVRGVYVENVTPGGAADKAVGGNHGVCLGDEILEINGMSLHEATYIETVNFFKELPLRIMLKIKRRPLALRLASQKKKDDSRKHFDKDIDTSANNSERNSNASDSLDKDETQETTGQNSDNSDVPQSQALGDSGSIDAQSGTLLPLDPETSKLKIPEKAHPDGKEHPLKEYESDESCSGTPANHSSSSSITIEAVLNHSPGNTRAPLSGSDCVINCDLDQDTKHGLRASGTSEIVQIINEKVKVSLAPHFVNDIHDINAYGYNINSKDITNDPETMQENPTCHKPDGYFTDHTSLEDYHAVELECHALENPNLVDLSENIELQHCQVDQISPHSSWHDVIFPGDILKTFDGTPLEGLPTPQVKHVICGKESGCDVTVSVCRRINKTSQNINEDQQYTGTSNGTLTCGQEVGVSGITPDKNTGIILHNSNSAPQGISDVKTESIKHNGEALFQENKHGCEEEKRHCVVGGLIPNNHWMSNPCHEQRLKELHHSHHLFAQSHGRLALENRSFRCRKCRDESGNNRTYSKSEPTSPRRCQCLLNQRSLNRDFSHVLPEQLSSAWSDHCHCEVTECFGVSDLAQLYPVTLESGYCSLDKHKQGLVCQALHSVRLDKLSSACDVTSDVILRESTSQPSIIGEFTGGYCSHIMDTQEVSPLPTTGPPGSSVDEDPPPLPGSLPPPVNFTEAPEEQTDTLDIDDCILCCDSDNEAVEDSDISDKDDIEGLSIFSHTDSVDDDHTTSETGGSHSFGYNEEIPAPASPPNLVPDNIDREELLKNYTTAISDTESLLNLSHDLTHNEEINHYADDVTLLSGTNPSVLSQERPEPLGGYDKSHSLETGTAEIDCYPEETSDAIGSQQYPTNGDLLITGESHITNHSDSSSVGYVSTPPNHRGNSSISSNSNNTVIDVNMLEFKNPNSTVNSELEFCTTSEHNYTEPPQQHSLQPNGVVEIDSSLQAVAMPVNASAEEADKTTETPGDYEADKSKQHAPPCGQILGQHERDSIGSSSSSSCGGSDNNSSDISANIHDIESEVRESYRNSNSAVVASNKLLCNSSHASGDGSSCSSRSNSSECADESEVQLEDVTGDQDKTLREDMYQRSPLSSSSLMSGTPGVAGSGKRYGQYNGTAATPGTAGGNVHKGQLQGEGYNADRMKNEASGSYYSSFVKQNRAPSGTLAQESSSATPLNVIHQGGLGFQSTATAECHSTEINRNLIECGHNSEEQVVSSKSEKCIEHYTLYNEQSSNPEGNTSLQHQPLLYLAGNISESVTKTAIYDSVHGLDKAQTHRHRYVPQTDTVNNGTRAEDSFITTRSASQSAGTIDSYNVGSLSEASENTTDREQNIRPTVTRKISDSGLKPPLPPKPKHLAPNAPVKSNNKLGGEINVQQGRECTEEVKEISAQSNAVKQTINSSLERGDTAVGENLPTPHQYIETDQSSLKELPSKGSQDLGNQSEGDDVDMLSRRVFLGRSGSSSSSSGDGRGSGDYVHPQPRPQMLLSAPRRVSASDESEADDILQKGSSKKQPLGEPWGVKLKSYTEATYDYTREDPMLTTGPRGADSDVISGVKLVAEVEKTFGGLGLEIIVQDSTAVVTSLKAHSPAADLGRVRVGDIVLSVNGKPLSGLNNIRVQQLLRLLPTGPVKLNILRERNPQTSANSYEGSAPVNQKPLKPSFDADVDYSEKNQFPSQSYHEKRIPPKTKEKPKVLPKSFKRSHDTTGQNKGNKVEQYHNDLEISKTSVAIESASISESTKNTDHSGYKFSPRTPPDGTDHPDDTINSHQDDVDKPSLNFSTKPAYVPEETLKRLTNQEPTGLETRAVCSSTTQDSFGVEFDAKDSDKKALTYTFDQPQPKLIQEDISRSVKHPASTQREEILNQKTNSPSVSSFHPSATAATAVPLKITTEQTADSALTSPLEVVKEEGNMELETSQREDDIQGVPRTSRSGSLRSANRESIIETMERKRRESTGSRLKGLQLPSGTKKPASSGGVVTELPTLFKPSVTSGLLPKPKERRSSYTALMPTSLWTKENSSVNGPTPVKVPSANDTSNAVKSPAPVFKVPAPVSSNRSLSSKKTVTSMSRSYSEDVPRSQAKEFSLQNPNSYLETSAMNKDGHSLDKSLTSKPVSNGANDTVKDNNTVRDIPFISQSVKTTENTETFETFEAPPVVNMNSFPPAINRDTLPLSPPSEQPPAPPPSQPVTRQLSLEIETITECPRHTIQLPSVKSPSRRTFTTPQSVEFSPNKDNNLNDSLLTGGSSLQSLDTTDTDSLPFSSSPKKGDGFVSPSSPLGVSKEDISEGRGSLVSTPDLDLDAPKSPPRSPTLSESDSGIFSAKLELKKESQTVGDKQKSPADQGPRHRTSQSSQFSSSSSYNSFNSTDLPKSPETTKSQDTHTTHRTTAYRLSQSSEEPKIPESSASFSYTAPTKDVKRFDDHKDDIKTDKSLSDKSSYSSYKVTHSSFEVQSSANTPDLHDSTQITETDGISRVSRSERLSTSSYKSSSDNTSSNNISPRSPAALTPRQQRIRSFEISTDELSPKSTSTNDIPRSERIRLYEKSTDDVSPRIKSSDEISPRYTSTNTISPRSSTSTNELSPRSAASNEDSPRSASTNQLSPRSTLNSEISPRSTSSDVSKEEITKPTVDSEAVKTSEGGVMEIELIKGAIGLGFCIEGGMGSPKGDMPVLVKRLFKGASAAQGKLQAGDEIIKVNGKDISHMSHYKAWNHLKSLPEGTIQMTIRRQ